jgi:hypothetical protein
LDEEHALHARAKKTFMRNIFINEKNCFLIVREKRRVNDPFEIFMSQNI